MAKKHVAKCIVSIPRAGEFMISIPIDLGPYGYHGVVQYDITSDLETAIHRRLKVKVTNAGELVKAAKAGARRCPQRVTR